ncbi:MAG: hypothetical protein JO269_09455 [Burkholderiaceae bacterium]|nr:hypothetical protein [Burkholderiaceae bacterium]
MKTFKIATLVLASLLVACGGGGGGASDPPAQNAAPPAVVTVPLETAMKNIATLGLSGSFTITGWINNSTPSSPQPNTTITGTGTISVGVATTKATSSDGRPVIGAAEVITGTLNEGGSTAPLSSLSTVYYDTSNYAPAYLTSIGIDISAFTVPATVTTGATGQFGASSNGYLTQSYTVKADGSSSTTVLFTVIQQYNNPVAGIGSQGQTVYRIDTAGNVSLVSIISSQLYLNQIFKTLTFTF